jgi:ribosomal protein S2
MKNMDRIPDIVIIIGQAEEINAVKKNVLGIRSITILDTDCDPSLADLLIPANDDSIPSIQLLLTDSSHSKENKILSKKLSVKKYFNSENSTFRFVLIYQVFFDPPSNQITIIT